MPKSAEAFRTISEVAEWLDTPTHVLRFWESKFPQVKPVKRAGGRRYYRPADMELLSGIKKLLHEDGVTIRGVQKILREQGVRHVCALSEREIEGYERPAAPVSVAAPKKRVAPVEEGAKVVSLRPAAETPAPAPVPSAEPDEIVAEDLATDNLFADPEPDPPSLFDMLPEPDPVVEQRVETPAAKIEIPPLPPVSPTLYSTAPDSLQTLRAADPATLAGSADQLVTIAAQLKALRIKIAQSLTQKEL